MTRWSRSAVVLLAMLPAAALGEIMWFDNEAEFVGFNNSVGRVFGGIETLEENTATSDFLGFDDPLSPGVPQGPFPNGLEGVGNMIVQANTLGNGQVPSMRFPSPNGLVHVSAAAGFGNESDMVLANQFVDGFDMIFPGADTIAVGFESMSLLGGSTISIEVFGPDLTTLIGNMNASAEPNTFVGISSDIPIGRINFYDFGNGAEGADNIQVWFVPEPASLGLLVLGGLGVLWRRG